MASKGKVLSFQSVKMLDHRLSDPKVAELNMSTEVRGGTLAHWHNYKKGSDGISHWRRNEYDRGESTARRTN